MVLHCATPSVSPPAATRPCRLHGVLPSQGAAVAAPARVLGHLPRLLVGVGGARADTGAWRVRRRVRYEEEDEEDDEEWGHNEDVARMERYTEDARDQALLVKARVDDEVEVVLVFRVLPQHYPILYVYKTGLADTRAHYNAAATSVVSWSRCFDSDAYIYRMHELTVSQGFSSSLSGRTAADPARSVLPERAIIQSVDVVKGPFDPNNIEYVEKGMEWDDFKSRLQ